MKKLIGKKAPLEQKPLLDLAANARTIRVKFFETGPIILFTELSNASVRREWWLWSLRLLQLRVESWCK